MSIETEDLWRRFENTIASMSTEQLEKTIARSVECFDLVQVVLADYTNAEALLAIRSLTELAASRLAAGLATRGVG